MWYKLRETHKKYRFEYNFPRVEVFVQVVFLGDRVPDKKKMVDTMVDTKKLNEHVRHCYKPKWESKLIRWSTWLNGLIVKWSASNCQGSSYSQPRQNHGMKIASKVCNACISVEQLQNYLVNIHQTYFNDIPGIWWCQSLCIFHPPIGWFQWEPQEEDDEDDVQRALRQLLLAWFQWWNDGNRDGKAKHMACLVFVIILVAFWILNTSKLIITYSIFSYLEYWIHLNIW